MTRTFMCGICRTGIKIEENVVHMCQIDLVGTDGQQFTLSLTMRATRLPFIVLDDQAVSNLTKKDFTKDEQVTNFAP